MKFSELIESSIECIKTFNPVYKTIDTHADEYLKDVSNTQNYNKVNDKEIFASYFFPNVMVNIKYFVL